MRIFSSRSEFKSQILISALLDQDQDVKLRFLCEKFLLKIRFSTLDIYFRNFSLLPTTMLSKSSNFILQPPPPETPPFRGGGFLLFLYSHFKLELGTQKNFWRYFRNFVIQKKILGRAGHPHAEISTKMDFKIFDFWPKSAFFDSHMGTQSENRASIMKIFF